MVIESFDLDVLRRLMDEASRLGVDFADIRLESTATTRIVLREGVQDTSSGLDVGAAIRVFIKGVVGFSYTSRLTLDSLKSALHRAYSMARAAISMPGERRPSPVTLKSLEDSYAWPQKKKLEDIPIDVKASDLVELDKAIAGYEFVKSRTVVYTERLEYKAYASTEDRLVEERRQLVYVAANAFASREGVTASAFKVQGTIKGYTIWEKEDQNSFGERLVDRLRKQLEAKTPKAGVFPVVLAPAAVGVLVHEAFGHLAEADLTVSGSALKGKLGEKVASSLVSIVDDPTIDDGFGTFKYDDEGVKTARAVIVDKGVLRQLMTDRVHSAMLNLEPTGNARAESYRVMPLIRMRNTIMLPGDATRDELFEGIDFGYYIVATMGGETNLDGSFQVGVQEAYEIVKGEVGSPVRNLSIAGNTLETLMNIDMVSKELEIFYGRCGKGQLVYVSDGGPHVRVKAMTVGGRETA
ncbi:MAG: TldD/PmbA family protein [Pyrodictiaceae archaeon]